MHMMLTESHGTIEDDCQANAAGPHTQNDEGDTFNTEFTMRDSSTKLTASYLNTKHSKSLQTINNRPSQLHKWGPALPT